MQKDLMGANFSWCEAKIVAQDWQMWKATIMAALCPPCNKEDHTAGDDDTGVAFIHNYFVI